MNDASFERELQDTFLTEAEEMLEDTEASFIAIESNPRDASKIDKIFRLVHTIKGGAHIAGFPDLGQFAHTFETLLGALRDKKLSVTSSVVDVLLEGNDTLKKFVAALRKDRAAKVNCAAVEERVKAVLLMPPTSSTKKLVEDVSSNTQVVKTSSDSQAPLFLVIDDEPDVLAIIQEILVGAGFNVITSDSAVTAIQLFKDHPVDVIFTDLKMPDIDGIEFIKIVRKINMFIPIGVISGHSGIEHLKDYFKIGVDSFLDKPFLSAEVLATAHRLWREGQLRASMLTLSKVCFQAYVAFDSILSTFPLGDEHKADKSALDQLMVEMREATKNLLASERVLKRCS